MRVITLIDQLLGYTDKVTANDADNDERRTLALQFVREVFADAWAHRSWWFKRSYDELTFAAATDYTTGKELATDFSSFGPDGGVYLDPCGEPLTQVSQQQLADLCAGGFSTDSPEVFAIWGQGVTAQKPLIHIPTTGGSVTLLYHYEAWRQRKWAMNHLTFEANVSHYSDVMGRIQAEAFARRKAHLPGITYVLPKPVEVTAQ